MHNVNVPVRIRFTTDADRHLPAYDYTSLSAANACPTWSILRYRKHLSAYPPSTSPTGPLGMGSACHEAFAAVRLFQLGYVQRQRAHYEYHSNRVFGTRWMDVAAEVGAIPDVISSDEDARQIGTRFAISAFRRYGYVEEEGERYRTAVNAEVALINYVNEWRWNNPILTFEDHRLPVGIEWAFDLTIDIGVTEDMIPLFNCKHFYQQDGQWWMPFRYVGRVDGIHVHGEEVRGHENKTTGRLNDSWESQFLLSHQITGYCIAISALVGREVSGAEVIGLAIPQPRGYGGGVKWVPQTRTQHHFAQWLTWVTHTLQIIWAYEDDPDAAPKYTHSCNRYFRTCMFLPYCYADSEERGDILREFYSDPWTPLQDHAPEGEAL